MGESDLDDGLIDLDRPSIARIYDYWLDGAHNFATDRELGDRVKALEPDVVHGARSNRAFLGRAVRYLRQQGVRQFLDIGSGIPTAANVHQIAQADDPSVRVVYVDIDPVACAHSRRLLAGNPYATIIRGDVRNPAGILDHPETRALLDFDEPIGLVLCAVLHFVADEHDPQAIMDRFAQALVPGSWLVLSHLTTTGTKTDVAHDSERMYEQSRANAPVCFRSREEISTLLEGWELVDPGLTWVVQWHPDPDDPTISTLPPERSWNLAAVGRKP